MMYSIRFVGAIVLTLVAVSSASAATNGSPEMSPAVAARVKRDVSLCKTRALLDACNDALRRTPSDPALLSAHGDALSRAGRTADALKQYRRAAALAPNQRGLNAKIAATEKHIGAKFAGVHTKPRTVAAAAAARVTNEAAVSSKSDHFSNAAPETQSH